MDSNPEKPVRFRGKLGCQDETWEVWGAVRLPLLENVWRVKMCHGKMLGPFPLRLFDQADPESLRSTLLFLLWVHQSLWFLPSSRLPPATLPAWRSSPGLTLLSEARLCR